MLVLTRKPNESIMIRDDIEVMVIGVHGDSVKLGIKAPLRISVNRKEVYDEICAANLAASKTMVEDLKHLQLFKKKTFNRED